MKEYLKKLILDALKELNIEYNLIDIEVPSNKEYGNYSSNVALKCAKLVNLNPRDLALKIKEKIQDEKIEKIEIAGPGFINFYLKVDYLYDFLNRIIVNNTYGSSDFGKNKKINIEFVSANPTGTLHLGHARGAAYGDALARIMSFAGYDVTREYYINDGGNQINNLAYSIYERYKECLGLECNLLDDYYHGPEIITIAKSDGYLR